jgi:hypothetical protein
MPRPPRPLALAALLLLTVLAAPTSPAEACGNEVARVIDPVNESIRTAERHLARDNHRAAAKAVLKVFPAALRADHRAGRPQLFARGQRIVALALVRSRGALTLPGLPGKTDAEREAGLAWAAATLRLHAARRDSDVLLTSELAEALALRPAERDEARTLLKDLADGDVMPTARAWAVLAALERSRGDKDAAERAVVRCQEIAEDKATCSNVGVS